MCLQAIILPEGMPGYCVFSEAWLTDDKYSAWLARTGDRNRARCTLCLKDFDVGNMGEAALKSHMTGKKHLHLSSMISGGQLTLKLTNSVTVKQAPSAATVSSQVSDSNTDRSQLHIQDSAEEVAAASSTLLRHVFSEAVLGAEVLWALKTCVSHYSNNSCTDGGPLFRKVFPDSEIASRFTCGETKCSYLLKFGVAPYFKQLLLDAVKCSPLYVILFDESLNKSTQEKQMDVHVRYWDAAEVHTRYLGSEFMGHAAADQLLLKLKSSLTGLRSKPRSSVHGWSKC